MDTVTAARPSARASFFSEVGIEAVGGAMRRSPRGGVQVLNTLQRRTEETEKIRRGRSCPR